MGRRDCGQQAQMGVQAGLEGAFLVEGSDFRCTPTPSHDLTCLHCMLANCMCNISNDYFVLVDLGSSLVQTLLPSSISACCF